MSRPRFSLAMLALASLTTAMTIALMVLPAQAQEAPPATPQNAPQSTAPRQPFNIKEVIDEIVWRPEQQGLFLVIAPEKVSRQMRATFTEEGTYVPPPQASLPPKSPEGLRISTLENYFPYRAVPCGDVTVFAPAKMHVLNYQNLPKPSAYAGFKPSDSFRLLQASLTEAQWRQVSSTAGLGLSDLGQDQRELFLASLPQPLIVQGNVDGKQETVRVNDSQRRGIRVRMAREMNWFFRQENGGGIGVGRTNKPNQLSVVSRESFDWESRQRQGFGVELLNEVPAHFKPGQLAFDWEGLNAEVDLREVKTVGDLIERARAATRVELYCDPRYARLPVYLRGDGARAGNLLKAVARGVTGTWRRLENAYVLTDDLTGLAVRHSLIADWVGQNTALASEVDRKVAQGLRKSKPAQYVQYDSDDPLKPSDQLITKYQQHQASLRAPRKESDPQPDYNKLWPVTELPPGAQDEIKRQVKDFADGRYGNNFSNVNTEAVQLNFNSVLKWEIPGIGLVTAPYTADVISVGEEQDTIQAQVAPKIEPQPLPAMLKTRAIVMKLGKEDATEKAMRAAHHAGFTEVWIEATPADATALAAAAQAAHRVGLGTRAVVSALRLKPGKGEGTDRNALGETYTQYLDRQLQMGAWPRNPWETTNDANANTVNPAETAARRQRERGDWLDPTVPTAEVSVGKAVQEISKIPGLDGIVLRDLTPPGYASAPSPNFSIEASSIGVQGGYSLARRLAFLRKFGVDPVDLSLTGNSGFNRVYLRFRENNYTQLELPFFPDYGAGAATTTINGINATQMGAGNSLEEWNRFRRDDAEKAIKRLQTHVQEVAGKTPVWYYQNAADLTPYWSKPSFIESRDKPEPTPATPVAPPPAPKPGTDYNPFAPPAPARATSSNLIFALDINALSGSSALGPQQNLLMMTNYLFNPKNTPLKAWDGLALDLSDETPGTIATLLDALPPPKPADPSTEKSATKKNARTPRP